jgi:hypothetical protein
LQQQIHNICNKQNERKQAIENITENTWKTDVLSQLFETAFPFRQAYV